MNYDAFCSFTYQLILLGAGGAGEARSRSREREREVPKAKAKAKAGPRGHGTPAGGWANGIPKWLVENGKSSYPLVNVDNNYAKIHHFSWVNPLFLWTFSIAMLNYQRVTFRI